MTPTLFRKPQRISITLPHQTYVDLIERSNREGRSISNLAAFLLEAGLDTAVEGFQNGRFSRAA